MSRPSEEKIHLSLGPGNRLYSEAYYLEALRPLGVTKRGLRRWMKALRVPFMEIGRHRLYDNLSLSMALRHVLRVGADDFYAPTSESVDKGRARASSLDWDSFQSNQSAIITELLYAQNHQSSLKPSQVRAAARKAAYRMAALGLSKVSRLDPALTEAYNQLRARVDGDPLDRHYETESAG